MSDAPITVAVVDDQELVRLGLRTLINSEADLELVGEAADGRAGLRLIRSTRPQVVLCDIRMPDVDGLALLREVTADASLAEVRVVMLTTFELDEYVFEALRNGASGFLLKDTDPGALLDAVRVVADGGSLLAPSVTRRVIEQFGTTAARAVRLIRSWTSSPSGSARWSRGWRAAGPTRRSPRSSWSARTPCAPTCRGPW